MPSGHAGIRRKYKSLRRYFLSENFEVDLVFNSKHGIEFALGLDYIFLLSSLRGKDVIYVRNNTRVAGFFSFFTLILLARLKRIKVYVEIPTWPFINSEYIGLKRQLHKVNFLGNLFLYKVTKINILLCSPNDFNFNVPYSRITNWLCDWEGMKTVSKKSVNNGADYIYVANMDKWHDPKKLISRFVNSNSTLLIVAPKLSEECLIMVRELPNVDVSLSPNEQQLYDLLSSAKIGIDTIGRLNGNYSLKSRDYLNFGLGVVIFHHDDKIISLTQVISFKSLESFYPDLVLTEFLSQSYNCDLLIEQAQLKLGISEVFRGKFQYKEAS